MVAADGANPGGFQAISCAGAALCVAADLNGNFVFTSTNPTGGVTAWTSTTGVAQNAPLAAIDCVSASLCVAEDVETDMVTTTDPTGPAAGWIGFDVGTPNHESGGVSCPDTTLCVAAGGQDIVTSTNP